MFVCVAIVVTSACGGDDRSPSVGSTPTAPAVATLADASTATPIPDDWPRFESEFLTIAVPPHYIGGNPDSEATFQAIRTLGPACAAEADAVEPLRDEYHFVAVDTESCASGEVRSLHVLTASSSKLTPGEFAEEFVLTLGTSRVLVDYREGKVGGLPAALMRTRREDGSKVQAQAVTAVRTPSGWIIVAAATSEEDFAVAAPDFAAIAASLRVK
jgi:hypothetical protein